MPAQLTELVQLDKPSLEPIPFEDVVTYLHSTKGEEPLVRMLMPASRQMLEAKLGIAFYTQQLRATFEFTEYYQGVQVPSWYRDPDERTCTIPRPPLQSYDLVEFETDIDQFDQVAAGGYQTITQFPAQIRLYTGFLTTLTPWWSSLARRPRMRVTYTCGYNTVDAIPERYKLMLLQVMAYNYVEREVGGIPATMSTDILGEKVITL
jgi:hypothetical protein